MKKKNFNIALVGLGNIGSNLYKHLVKNKESIKKKTNSNISIKYVSAKNRFKKRNISIPKNKWVANYLNIAKNPDIDIVVELIGGSEGPAKKLVFNSIKNKKHVVTANKSLISKYGDQLSKLAEKNKVNLEFEAAVAGGVPIIRVIKEGLITNSINKIYGILNGTSNYILSEMTKSDSNFKEVLLRAQKLGYAESNPSNDITGKDAYSKIQILSSLAFNSFINREKSNVEGISTIDQIDIHNAKILGYVIKHLAIAELKKNKVIQRVYPCMVHKNSYISNISGVLNAVIIEGKPIGKFTIQGEGAGPGPTTSALVSDICSIVRGNIKFPFSIPNKSRKKIKSLNISNEIFSSYIRLDVIDKTGVLSSITKILSKNKISVKRLIQNPFKSKKFASIIIISHKAKNLNLVKTLKELGKQKFVINKPKFFRIEEI
ncbi:MAG: homoserine dehydrogenase [Pelagibacteraceae bacterium TMED247]|nr:homoserine dehydrogenase [Candidatus Pelagibacter sp.]RPG05840.1 MAG: homoserine dehydrogenase [Pelagibacteraceae bacterium TMED247]